MVNGTLQWETPQSWFLSCSIVSRYSSQGEYWEECFLCQLLNCKKNNGRDSLWCSSMGDSPRLISFLLNCVYILHHNDQVNVSFSSSSIARKIMVEMLYGATQWDIPQAWFLSFSINSLFLAPQCIPCSKQNLETCGGDA